MKKRYATFYLIFFICASAINAQVVNQIYDHDTTDLNQLHNMPFDETQLLVVSGNSYSPSGIHFHELDQVANQLTEITFTDVDTIFSTPEFKDDKLFFEASINGLGRELVAYDGTSTYFFDFNLGAGNSNPQIIEFENDIYVIAYDGALRQLFKYTGGTSFQQISEEIENDVDYFIATRGNEYYYITFSTTNGRSVMSTEDNNGTLIHSYISPASFQESLGDVVLSNGAIYLLSYYYTVIDASYRIDKIDANNLITTHHFQDGSLYSSGHLLEFDDEILFYRTEPNHTEILNVSTAQQPFVQISLDPAQYNLIGNHVVQNNKLFIFSDQYILDVSGATPIPIIENGSYLQLIPALVSDSSFYLYEIAPMAGQSSNVVEVSSINNQIISYPVSTEGSYLNITQPMVKNNGELKFIFRTQGASPSSDIYAFSSVSAIEEQELTAFDLYPNPSIDGRFSIVLPHEGDVNIFTLEGQMIQSKHYDLGINTVDVGDLTSGVYFIEFNSVVQRIFVD